MPEQWVLCTIEADYRLLIDYIAIALYNIDLRVHQIFIIFYKSSTTTFFFPHYKSCGMQSLDWALGNHVSCSHMVREEKGGPFWCKSGL